MLDQKTMQEIIFHHAIVIAKLQKKLTETETRVEQIERQDLPNAARRKPAPSHGHRLYLVK